MLTDFDTTPQRERVIVALDCTEEKAYKIADELQGHASWLKVGMTLYYAAGPQIITAFKQKGFNVFLDLKLHDIPFQVEGAAYNAAKTGADMLTMHCLGGLTMLQAAQRGVSKVAEEQSKSSAVTLGITVLTSMNSDELTSIGIERTPAEQVDVLGRVAQQAQISGVVASPQEATRLRDLLGPASYIVTPGVRPQGCSNDDQSRVATPCQAFEAGASHIVVGRPIVQAESPKEAFEALAEQLECADGSR